LKVNTRHPLRERLKEGKLESIKRKEKRERKRRRQEEESLL
jgi:hypothetical protein